MSTPDSLCIDLGASYTKVAVRSGADGTTRLLTDPELPDGFCIPSVAARDTQRDRWVFGPDAVDLRASERVELHLNWKSDLFAPGALEEGDLELLDGHDPEADRLLLAHVPALRAFDVARRYLTWLHDEQIPDMLGHGRFHELATQLCVPNFVLESSLAPRLETLLREVGFSTESDFTLSEPRANLIGVLTEGRNPRTASGLPNLGAMFGDAAVLRTLASSDQGVLLVDVGAFTTDLALASFARHDGGGFDDDPAMSVRLGVEQLDAWLLESATDEARARALGSATEREHFRRAVYGSRTADGPAEFGLTRADVGTAIKRLVRSVLHAVDAFLSHADTDKTLFAAVLTGGGCNIVGIGNALAEGLAKRGVGTLHAPRTTDVPGDMHKLVLGPELVRGASAVGGCSILYRL
ncbi:MAG: hypothetical protein KTR31_41435 [Myxococcales bacterium]|nr:hypothetical protein [Myxococcales bacterium]